MIRIHQSEAAIVGLFLTFIGIMLAITLVATARAEKRDIENERVKCESLLYLAESPKDSLLIIRADPNCIEF